MPNVPIAPRKTILGSNSEKVKRFCKKWIFQHSISQKLRGAQPLGMVQMHLGRRPKPKNDEFFECAPLSFRDNEHFVCNRHVTAASLYWNTTPRAWPSVGNTFWVFWHQLAKMVAKAKPTAWGAMGGCKGSTPMPQSTPHPPTMGAHATLCSGTRIGTQQCSGSIFDTAFELFRKFWPHLGAKWWKKALFWSVFAHFGCPGTQFLQWSRNFAILGTISGTQNGSTPNVFPTLNPNQIYQTDIKGETQIKFLIFLKQ